MHSPIERLAEELSLHRNCIVRRRAKAESKRVKSYKSTHNTARIDWGDNGGKGYHTRSLVVTS